MNTTKVISKISKLLTNPKTVFKNSYLRFKRKRLISNINLNASVFSIPDATILDKQQQIEIYKLLPNVTIQESINTWNFQLTTKLYQKEVYYSEEKHLEYIMFLADTGQLNILYQFIINYGFKYLEELSKSESYIFSRKKNVLAILNFFKSIYIPLKENCYQGQEDLPIYLLQLVFSNDMHSLKNYFDNNTKQVFKNNLDFQSLIVINLCINLLVENNLLSVDLGKEIISFSWGVKTSIIRKKYLVSITSKYFLEREDRMFFTPKKIWYDHLQQLLSFIARHSIKEGLPKNLYMRITSQMSDFLPDIHLQHDARIAVCISGMHRVSNNALTDILNNIVIPLNADVFIHSWDEWQVWSGLGNSGESWFGRIAGSIHESKCPVSLKHKKDFEQHLPLTYKRISTPFYESLDHSILKSVFPQANILTESAQNFTGNLNTTSESFKSRGHYNQAKMFYGIYKSHKMLLDFEEKNSIQYDYIFRCRPDISIQGSINTKQLDDLKNNEIAVHFDHIVAPDDTFYYGRRDTMISMSKLWKTSNEYKKINPFNGYTGDAHSLMLLWMLHNKIIPTSYTSLTKDLSVVTQNVLQEDFLEDLKNDFKNTSISEFDQKKIYELFTQYLIKKDNHEKIGS